MCRSTEMHTQLPPPKESNYFPSYIFYYSIKYHLKRHKGKLPLRDHYAGKINRKHIKKFVHELKNI